MGIFNFFGSGFGSGGRGRKIDNFIYVGNKKKLPSTMDIKTVEDINELIPTGGRQDFNAALYASARSYDNILNYRYLYRDSFEVFFAVNEIVNEAVVVSNTNKDETVDIDLSNLSMHDVVKDAIRDSFQGIKYMLNWKQNCQAIFKRWYIDGRRYFYPIVSDQFITSGINEIKILSPFYVTYDYRKKEENELDDDASDFKKYWKLRDINNQVYEIDNELLVCGDSGFYDPETGESLSYLSLCEKHYNRLDLVENSMVIYRIVRAPERRIFKVQIRKNARNKVKAQIKDLMRAYSNSAIFDSNLNRVDSKKAFVSMTSDIWVTEDDEGKGTKVETLAGGSNVGEVTDVELFKKNLIKSLNIPVSSYFDQGGLNFGMGTQITEERKRFYDYVCGLRNQFNNVFYDLMKIDLICKKVINEDEWDEIRQYIDFKWASNSYFSELKELEVFNSKLDAIDRIDPYLGKLFDDMFVYKEILNWPDEKIQEMKQRLEVYNEKEEPTGEGEEPTPSGGGGGMPNLGGPDEGQFPTEEDLAGGEEVPAEEGEEEIAAIPEETAP